MSQVARYGKLVAREGSGSVAAVMALVEDFEVFELEPLVGKGPGAGT